MKGLAAVTTDDKVDALATIMKSRTLVHKVISDMDLDLTGKTELEVEALIEDFQKKTEIKIEFNKSSRKDIDFFTVSFRHRNPKNVRDLGGLKTVDGRTTRWGAVVRSDTPARLTETGWAALNVYRVRTIITLRTHGMVEDELDFVPRYSDIATVQAPIEAIADTEFVQQWVDSSLWGTPLYFEDAPRRWPERHAAALSAVAQARPGGVLFHSILGYDRTGIIALLLLGLADVTPDEIIADYELSVDPIRDELLIKRQTSNRDVILDTLAKLDIDSYLLSGGMSEPDLEALRERLLEPMP